MNRIPCPFAPRRRLTPAAALFCGGLAAAAAMAGDDLVPPTSLTDYRFVNAFVVDDPENPLFGMHEFYVNRAGMPAFRRGEPYPEGAEFLGMVYGLERGDGTLNEGDGQAIALMRKVAGAEATGGWQFAMFAADGTAMDIDPVKDCFECHTQVADRDFVFSEPRAVGDLGTLPAADAAGASQ
jgi:hypothetical protein